MIGRLAGAGLLAVAGLAGTGAATDDGERMPQALAGRIAGPPVDCIDVHRVLAPEIVDGQTILYRQNGRRTFRTGPVGACPALRPQATLVAEVQGNRICRRYRFRVVSADRGALSGYCRFGGFTPYDKVPD